MGYICKQAQLFAALFAALVFMNASRTVLSLCVSLATWNCVIEKRRAVALAGGCGLVGTGYCKAERAQNFLCSV